ncbi:hypothetical protein MMC25_001426 [Agyrium rufum]|nr:hypothetical protein [Agyrium rufum]
MGQIWKGSDCSTISTQGSPRFQIQDIRRLFVDILPKAIPSKFQGVQKRVEEAFADKDRKVLYLNYCEVIGIPSVSPYDFAMDGLWIEGGIIGEAYHAEGVEQRLDAYFIDVVQAPGRCGLILMDFPEELSDFIAGLVKSNADQFINA